jgi:hypothetical protein
MYQYKKDSYNYEEAIKLKHEENIAIAKEHNVKKSKIINTIVLHIIVT